LCDGSGDMAQMVTDLYFGIRLEPPTISLTIAHELAARAQRA
jgi:hypothetical protein